MNRILCGLSSVCTRFDHCRIAALEEQLNLYQKNGHVDKVRAEMEKLLEDKAKFHTITREALT